MSSCRKSGGNNGSHLSNFANGSNADAGDRVHSFNQLVNAADSRVCTADESICNSRCRTVCRVNHAVKGINRPDSKVIKGHLNLINALIVSVNNEFNG